MSWGEQHKPANGGSGTTGQIEIANDALDKLDIAPGPLALRVLELVGGMPEGGVVPVNQLRGAIKMLSPDEMTPTAKRLLESICEQHKR